MQPMSVRELTSMRTLIQIRPFLTFELCRIRPAQFKPCQIQRIFIKSKTTSRVCQHRFSLRATNYVLGKMVEIGLALNTDLMNGITSKIARLENYFPQSPLAGPTCWFISLIFSPNNTIDCLLSNSSRLIISFSFLISSVSRK